MVARQGDAADKCCETILGIDPGTNILGYGVISGDGGSPLFVDVGVLDLRKESDPYAKLARIFEKISFLADYYHPQALACESPFYGKNAQVVLKLGRAQGAAIVAAAHKGIPVFEYAPRAAKMAIAGNGAASKEQVNMMVQKTLKIEFEPRFLDATDALAIALCHYYSVNSPLARSSFASSVATASSNSLSEHLRHRSGGTWEKFVSEHPEKVKKGC